MKKALMLIAAVFLSVSGPLVFAEDQSSLMLSDQQISLIRANCTSVQSSLTRIHANDALSRVHLGQEYETLSTKFMAPMNSRVALAKLDGVALTKTTVDFNTKLDNFRTLYQQYEETMLRAIQMKCGDQPVAFYDTLTLAQSDRASVRDAVTSLGNLVSQYRGQVNDLRQKVLTNGGITGTGDTQ